MDTFNLKKLTPNPNNPRVLRDDQYKKLLASIKRDPEFLYKRPIVHADGVIPTPALHESESVAL